MTVAELEPRLTMRELLEWQTFEEEFGPITLHERVDGMAQMIAYTVHASAGGEATPDKFKPRWHKPRRWTDEELFAWLDVQASKGD